MDSAENAKVMAQLAYQAGDLIEDAGVRFMAMYWERAPNPQGLGVALIAWCVAIDAFAKKAKELLQVVLDAQDLGEVGIKDAFKAHYGAEILSPSAERIRKKIAEYATLERLGEGT